MFDTTYATYRRYEKREIDAQIDREIMSVWEGGADATPLWNTFSPSSYGMVVAPISASVLTRDYATEIGKTLTPTRNPRYTALDTYAGAGGLSLGLEAAGFRVTGIERNADCCDTYNANLRGVCKRDTITPEYDFPTADVVTGGPPCQPFSVHGKQMGTEDRRNGIPSFVAAVRKIKPRMCIFENVRGILYRNREYFEWFVGMLKREGYDTDVAIVNCADYGVPQTRERVIVVGHRGGYSHPTGLDRRITAGEALDNIPDADREEPIYLTPNMDKYIAIYERASKCRPRDLNMSRPARTLTCRNLAGYSSDMHRIRTGDGRRRLLYVREAARLQGFPDWYAFSGSRGSALTQIGNAVPPPLALAIGRQAMACLEAD